MLSRLVRFIRGRFARNRGRGTEDEGAAEQRAATGAPPAEGDPFAQEVLRRVRPRAASRVPSRSSLAVSARRPLIQAEAPRVRQDVPSAALPLATSAHPSALPDEVEAGEAPGGDTQFYEGSTGDARWDALWTMRGTPREATLPDREGSPTPAPRDHPASRRSEPAGRRPSVQRAPSPPVRGTGPAGEGLAHSSELPVQRMPGEVEAELREVQGVEQEAAGEEQARPRPLPRGQDEPQAPAPGQQGRPLEAPWRAGEGARPAARAEDAPLRSRRQERAPAEGTRAPEPPHMQRRIVPRSALEELPARREAPSPSSGPAPEPGPQVSVDREPHVPERRGPPSPVVAPPPVGTPVQRASAVPGGEETESAEAAPSPEGRESKALLADDVPPEMTHAAPDRPRQEVRRRAAQPPAPVQRTAAQGADRPVESPPLVPQAPPAQRAATEVEPLAEGATQEPPALERATGELPAAERPHAARSLDRRPPVERPPAEPPPPERPRASARDAEREGPHAGPPETAREARAEAARPTGVRGRSVQAQPAAPAVGERPEEPAVRKPAVQKLAVQKLVARQPAVQEEGVQEATTEPLAAEGAARDRSAPSRAAARPMGHAAEAQEVSAAAARVQREADTESTGEAAPDRRTLLRQAMQPRIVPTVVQAAPADGTGATAGAAPQGTAAGAPEAAEEPDVESLARDVYRILRRRLLVERERELGAH